MIFPKIFWCYCLLILQVMCRDPPTVKIKDQGMIMGMFMKMYRTQSIVAYLGIPYAHPPIGMYRFSPPIVDNIPSWDGVRNGSVSQPNCFQNTNNPKQKHTMVLNKLLTKVMDIESMMSEMGSDQYDEDCLYLNLFVPDGESTQVKDKSLMSSHRFLARSLSNVHFVVVECLSGLSTSRFLASCFFFRHSTFYRFQPLNFLIYDKKGKICSCT